MKELIEECTSIIKKSENIVVLTGAGISTESGIPDFRSKSGIYSHGPEEMMSLDFFFEYPKEFYQFAIDNIYRPNAQPNDGHKIVAKWEKDGKVRTVITQNIDGLHQLAGSKQVVEFHGTMKTATCLNCRRKYSTAEIVKRMDTIEEYYICNHCHSPFKEDRYIKPDVVLFGDAGEWFTFDGYNQIMNMITEADCLIVLGSSLKVTPFSTFPTYRLNGVPLIIVNKGSTAYDIESDTYVIKASIGETLREIDEQL